MERVVEVCGASLQINVQYRTPNGEARRAIRRGSRGSVIALFEVDALCESTDGTYQPDV